MLQNGLEGNSLVPGIFFDPQTLSAAELFFLIVFVVVVVVFKISSHHQPTVFIVFVEKLDKKAGNSIALTALALASHEMGLFHPKEKVGHRV